MPPQSASSSPLPINDLAAAYQPRRIVASMVSIVWNILLASLFLFGGGASRLQFLLTHCFSRHHWVSHATLPAYLIIFFSAHALLNYPLELWFGYLEERQFGLAKDGIRAWSRDWLAGVAQHGTFFFVGSSSLLSLQRVFPLHWLGWITLLLLALFLTTSYYALSLLPRGLFQLEPISPSQREHLDDLLSDGAFRGSISLPPIVIFSAPHLRDFSGGLVGLGRRQTLLLSRSTITAASDSLLRFILLHELGHKRYHHLLLATLAGWAWVVLGLCGSHAVILRWAPESVGHSPYIAWMALTLSLWMGVGEPILAYLGRRLEYQADRFYLTCGGRVEEMRVALDELSRRNLARTEGLRRRHTMFHPLPSVWNRLHAARRFAGQMKDLTERTS
jgi:Zn-dependent protease with chaperone function